MTGRTDYRLYTHVHTVKSPIGMQDMHNPQGQSETVNNPIEKIGLLQ